jgi:hypothetical protein
LILTVIGILFAVRKRNLASIVITFIFGFATFAVVWIIPESILDIPIPSLFKHTITAESTPIPEFTITPENSQDSAPFISPTMEVDTVQPNSEQNLNQDKENEDIFFINNAEDHKIFSYNPNTSTSMIVVSDPCCEIIRVDQGRIFYQKADYKNDGGLLAWTPTGIYSSNIDGTNELMLNIPKYSEVAMFSDDYVFYNSSEDSYALHMCNLDGTDDKQLVSTSCGGLFLTSEKLFYSTGADDGYKFYYLNLKTMERVKLSDETFTIGGINTLNGKGESEYNGSLYLTKINWTDGQIGHQWSYDSPYVLDLSSYEISKYSPIKDPVETIFSVQDGYIYYQTMMGDISRTSLLNGETNIIATDQGEVLKICDDSLYYLRYGSNSSGQREIRGLYFAALDGSVNKALLLW